MSNDPNSQPNNRAVVRSSGLDHTLAHEIMEHPGGEKLSLCYQCGACAGGCPVGKITDSYKPRHLIRMALLGLRKELVTSEAIWLCASCYTCQERCPQGVEIADLVLAMRNIAVKDGFVPDSFIIQAKSLIENGRLVPVSRLTNRQRSRLGLRDLTDSGNTAIRKIVTTTGFQELIEKLRS